MRDGAECRTGGTSRDGDGTEMDAPVCDGVAERDRECECDDGGIVNERCLDERGRVTAEDKQSTRYAGRTSVDGVSARGNVQ